MPGALSPTCCRRGTGRLRVFFGRSPFARIEAYFRSLVAERPGTFAEGDFQEWTRDMLTRRAAGEKAALAHMDRAHTNPVLEWVYVFSNSELERICSKF